MFYWHVSYLQISTDITHTFRFLLTLLIPSNFYYWQFSYLQISPDISHSFRFLLIFLKQSDFYRHFSYLQIRLPFLIPPDSTDIFHTFWCSNDLYLRIQIRIQLFSQCGPGSWWGCGPSLTKCGETLNFTKKYLMKSLLLATLTTRFLLPIWIEFVFKF